mgnify:CR=1 FL=1
MKTAISLRDKLFHEADQVAESLEISRSELYARAIAEFVGKLRAGEIRESYDRAYGEAETPVDSGFRRKAASQVLVRSEW